MLPLINNKSFLECNGSDFCVILNNPDYRENHYIDYKQIFSFLDGDKKKAREQICEFRNDVCAFANSDGGYLIYGIADKEGLPTEVIGVDIKDPDLFERDIRNKLNSIMPKLPTIQFNFVKLTTEKYIVVIFVDHDNFAPYLHLEDEKNYKIYKRDGNRKTTIKYTELKQMFIQSRVLETEIQEFRNNRIKYVKGQGMGQFLLFHIIPESFQNNKVQLFLLEKQRGISFASVFVQAGIDSKSIPCVDGLRYFNTYGDEKAVIYNSGIVEYLLPLERYIGEVKERPFFSSSDVWNKIDIVSQGYRVVMPNFFGNQRYYGCISIIGCDGVITEGNELQQYATRIDRNKIVCEPIVFTNIEDTEVFNIDLKRLHLEYLLALGKRNSDVNSLIKDITSAV